VQAEIDGFDEATQSREEKQAAAAIERALQRGRITNPALLIPVDASAMAPYQRLYPITFRNLADHLVWVWDQAWDAYQRYQKIEPHDTPEGAAAFYSFAQKRAILIGNLRAFSHLLAANKAVAMRGESLNLAILRLIAHLPPVAQWTLNMIPQQSPVLNEVIKGDEVYSNVGRVASGSSLTRFMSAKDDGNTKALVWGVMTTDEGRLVVTMRDFREFIRPLVLLGRVDLAHILAQDYVDTYTAALIGLVARLWAMLQSRPPVVPQ
jgi:hypothetical protein